MLGAHVDKVEPPNGEVSRQMALPVDGSGYLYYVNNTDKTGVTLDIREPADRARLDDLLSSADAFVSNLAPSTLRRFDLAPSGLVERFAGLVACGISGFGGDAGPDGDKAFDTVIQAASGVMDATGTHVGPPTKSGVSLADLLGGFAAAAGVLCGLVVARRSGNGCAVDVAMSDVALWASSDLWELARTGRPVRLGNESRRGAPTAVVATAEGFVALGPGTRTLFRALADDLQADPDDLEATTSALPSERVLAAAERSGLPATRVADLADLLRDPQVAARGLLIEQTLPSGRRIRVLGSPFHHLRSDVGVRRAAPPLSPRGTSADEHVPQQLNKENG